MVLADDMVMKGEEMSRNSLQKVAMSAIYGVLLRNESGESVDVEKDLAELCDCPYSEVDPFIKSAVICAIKNYSSIIASYQAHMRRWTFDRLNLVEQSILFLAYVHFYYIEPGIDKKVVINVAVKLTKAYCGENDYKFVNGILDNVLIETPSESEDEF